MITHAPPVLGFVGSSGSGKTMLLEQVIGKLADTGVRVAVLKHAKPGFDLDQNPRKDSCRLRSAGADQVLIASRDRWALIAQQADPRQEPSLQTMLRHLDASALDASWSKGSSTSPIRRSRSSGLRKAALRNAGRWTPR
jgi:molybdopterin-guanine dinucleotide biosynthesis protein MobB